MSEDEVRELINNINDGSQLLSIMRYAERRLESIDGSYFESSTEVISMTYGEKPIEIVDLDMGEIPWL